MKLLLCTIFASTLLALAPSADAKRGKALQNDVSGSYAVSFEKIIDNCKTGTVVMKQTKLTITSEGRQMTILIDELPGLTGKLGRRGKLRASASRQAAADRTNKFNINGRVSGNDLHAVFMIEHYENDKPVCTQSYNLTGKRK